MILSLLLKRKNKLLLFPVLMFLEQDFLFLLIAVILFEKKIKFVYKNLTITIVNIKYYYYYCSIVTLLNIYKHGIRFWLWSRWKWQ